MFGISTSSIASFGRHTLTFSMGVAAALSALHAITPADATTATNAFTQISTGMASVIAGVSTLIAMASGLYAGWQASPFSKMLSVAHNPQVSTIVVKSPALAESVPSAKVVAQ